MNQDLDKLVTELQAIPEYRTLFNVAFPNEGISIDNLAKAIATYERTVVSAVAPFDSWIAGDELAISEPAKRGFDLYNGKANCVACHSGWNLTDDSFHDIGMPDADNGRGDILPEIDALAHAFKTPTLRNIELRGPYMHDGSLADLMAVIDHYNEGGEKRPSLSQEMKPLNLTEAEKVDLILFLATLTSQDDPVPLPVLPNGKSMVVIKLSVQE